MRILTNKKMGKLLKSAYEKGVARGYELGKLMREVEIRNRGIIFAGYDVQKEVDEILKQEGG